MALDLVTDADAATTNAFFRALAAERRRRALRWLAANDPVPLPVLAGALADSPPDDRDRVRLDLYHRHLPLLVEAGLVARSSADLLTTTDRGEAAVAVIEAVETTDGDGPPTE